MRFHRISLRNFRGVAACDVPLAAVGVTIVEGDNETGKTSLARAVDLILEFPDSSRAGPVQDAQPVHVDKGPEVEIDMSVGEHRFVYNKRWLRRPTTTLTIETPRREQLTGREAHDRVSQILNDHADMALWRALHLEQGVDLSQAQLGQSRTLMKALEASSGSSSASDAAADLMGRVNDEFSRYYTPTGQPNKHLRSVRESATNARERAVTLAAALSALDNDVERHARLTNRLADAGPRRAEQSKLVAEFHEKGHEIDALAEQVARSGDRVRLVELEAAEARNAVAVRAELVSKSQERAASCELLAGALDAATAAIGQTARERTVLRDEANAARRVLAEAEAWAVMATADHEHHRHCLAHDLMQTRHAAVLGALEKRQAANVFLDTCKVDDGLLRKIEAADRSVVETRAVLSANRTVVRTESLADQTIVFDDEERDLEAGDVLEEPVAGTLTIRVPDRILLQVSAGADTQEQADDHAAAQDALEALLRRAGVADLVAARGQLQQRRSMMQSRDEANEVLKTNLRDLTPDEMVAKLERFDTEMADYVARRAATTPLPVDLPSAEEAVRAAGGSLNTARAAAEDASDALAQAGADQVDAEKALAAQQALHTQASAELASMHAQIDADRSAVPDETLDAELATGESAVRAAAAELAAAQTRLLERDPETVAASLENAVSALTRIEDEAERDAAELQRLEGRLDAVGEQGLFDMLSEAKTDEERATQEMDALDRRASASQLLHEVLNQYREAARRRYRAPLKERIEQLGRVVFGDDLSVELDADLAIVQRTLDGVTVPYNSLSTGAREQLCAIERLASAALVSGDGGAPVMFDDALGYSDPDRLRRLGAVLGMAGRDCQVILLTCMPERYRHVGGATVVRLDAERGEGDGEG